VRHVHEVRIGNIPVPTEDEGAVTPRDSSLVIRKLMKQKKVLKSFADLSAELIGAEAAKPEETNLRHLQVVTQEPSQIPRPDGFVEVSPDPGYRHWGLNE